MIAKLAILVIRIYQLTLSPLLGPVCRFTPSCSRYAVTCLQRFGFFRGSWMAALRIARCNPWHPGGYDPPPLLEGEAAIDAIPAKSTSPSCEVSSEASVESPTSSGGAQETPTGS